MRYTDENAKKVIEVLLLSPTNRKAAEKLGISERALYNFRQNAKFKTAYRAAVREILEGATRTAQSGMASSVEVLRHIAEDPEENAQTRTQAARLVLEYGIKLTETMDIIERLEEVERRLNEE